MLDPLLGNNAAIVFAIALLFAGISSSMTSGISAGSIFAGMYGEPYDVKDIHLENRRSNIIGACSCNNILINDPFKGLIISQAILSIQLPITIFLQVRLTSSKEVMGKYANKPFYKIFIIFDCSYCYSS